MGVTPIRLERAPLIEALFEIRFDPTNESAGDLLPGLLYQSLGETYRDVETLPMASMPPDIRSKDPNLRYKPYHRLRGKNLQISIGHRVVTLSESPPYSGWDHHKERILELLKSLRETRLIGSVERFSLKCINVIQTLEESQLSLLDASIEIAGKTASDNGFHLRAETLEGNFVNIIEILPNTTVMVSDGSQKNGLMLNVDTIRNIDTEHFWEDELGNLEQAHAVLKNTFFKLLKDETIKGLVPVWQ